MLERESFHQRVATASCSLLHTQLHGAFLQRTFNYHGITICDGPLRPSDNHDEMHWKEYFRCPGSIQADDHTSRKA